MERGAKIKIRGKRGAQRTAGNPQFCGTFVRIRVKLEHSSVIRSYERWLLLAILVLGTLLRLYRLDAESLWYDELHSIIPTAPEKSISSIIDYCRTDQPPFFFLYLHAFFKLFGYSAWLGRLACAIVGIASIPVMYALGKEVRNANTGLFAAGLTAINYFHIYYSQELRFYSMAFLLSALSFLWVVRILKFNRLSDYIFYALTTSALLYTHYYGMIIFACQAILFVAVPFFPQRREKSFYYRSVIAGLLVVCSFLPWVPTVLQDAGLQQFWIERPSITFAAHYFFDYTGKDEVSAVIFSICVVFFGFEFLKTQNRVHFSFWLLILWIGISYGLPYIRSLVSTPMLHIRYTIVTLPAWLVVIAMGWQAIKSSRFQFIFSILIAVSSLLNLFLPNGYYSVVDKPQIREACNAVRASMKTHRHPIYSTIPWHLNFFFSDTDFKVEQILGRGSSGRFWLLQSKSSELMDAELRLLLPQHSIVQEIRFFDARAVLMSTPIRNN